MILAFSPTNCFQTRAYLFGNTFALQLETPANWEFTTAHSNPFQVTYSHCYKLTVYLPLKHLLTPKFQPLDLPLSTTEAGTFVLALFSSQRCKAASYLLAASFPCPIYRRLSGSHGKGRFKLLWLHCRWIWPCQTFSLVVWEGHSPWYTVYGPAKLGNTWPALSPMSPLLH